MIRFFYLLTSLLLLSFIGNAQTNSDLKNNPNLITYTGKIVDTETGEPLPFAQINHIYKPSGSDSLVIRNSVADREGNFKILSPRVMNNRIEVVCLGYKILTRMLSEAGNKDRISYSSTLSVEAGRGNKQPTIYNQLDLGVLKLVPDVQQLDAVLVKARVKLFEQVGDTLLVYPKNIKQFEGETLEDILKRLPNFHVDEHGNIYVNGQRVERAKLNDKHIFGEDVRTTVTSILAKEAGLIQVYDEVDEKSEIMHGTKNARKRKVMNVITFKDFNMFKGGDVSLEAGLYADKNADNERQTMHNLSGRIGQYSSNFRIAVDARTEKTAFPQKRQESEIGFNTQVSSDELLRVLGFDYSYGKFKQEQESRTDQFYFPTSYFESQIVNRTYNSVQDQNVHKFSLSGGYTEKMKYSVSGSYSGTVEDVNMQTISINNMTKDGEQFSYLQQVRESDNRKQNHNANIDMMTRLKGIGNIQLMARGAIVKNADEGIRVDSSYTGGVLDKQILSVSGDSPEYRMSTEIFYIKRLGKVSLSYRPSFRYDQSNQLYMALDQLTGEVDSITSRDQIQKNLKITNGVSGRLDVSDKFDVGVSVAYNAYWLRLDERLVDNLQTKKNLHTWNGGFNFNYRPFMDNSFKIDGSFMIHDNVYTVNNLSSRLRDNNPMNLWCGNPNLKISTNYEFRADFYLQNVMRVAMQYKIVKDPVISARRYFETNTPLDEYGGYVALAGATLTTPINARNHSEYQLNVSSNTKGGVVMVKGDLSYRFVNPEVDLLGEIVRSYTQSPSLSLSVMSNFSSTIRLDVRNRVSYGYTKIKSTKPQSHNWINNNFMVDFGLNLFSRMLVDADYKYDYYYDSRTKRSNNLHTLNASVDYRIFSNRRGVISFNAYNLLNTKSSLTTSNLGLYIQNEYRPENSTLLTISFKYKFGVEQ